MPIVVRPSVVDVDRKIAGWLKENQRSQRWLAEQLGDVTQQSVGRWANGHPISPDAADRIREVTGVLIDTPHTPKPSSSVPSDDASDSADPAA